MKDILIIVLVLCGIIAIIMQNFVLGALFYALPAGFSFGDALYNIISKRKDNG